MQKRMFGQVKSNKRKGFQTYKNNNVYDINSKNNLAYSSYKKYPATQPEFSDISITCLALNVITIHYLHHFLYIIDNLQKIPP